MEKEQESYKLCYIDGQKAFFTDNFEEQWGDDWNDAPYEHNAGDPYNHYYKDKQEYPINLVELYFEIPRYWLYLPCDHFTNSPYSVEAINKGAIAWIHTDDFNIQAGTSLKDFIDIILKNGGSIWKKI